MAEYARLEKWSSCRERESAVLEPEIVELLDTVAGEFYIETGDGFVDVEPVIVRTENVNVVTVIFEMPFEQWCDVGFDAEGIGWMDADEFTDQCL